MALLGTALALCGVPGCGPVGYINQVTRKASASLASAEAARAQVYSPYWYTLAVEYLHKAREEASYADFEAANRFGRKADEAARKAKDEAIARAKDPGREDWLPPRQLRDQSTQPLPDGAGDENLAPAVMDGLSPAVPSESIAPAGDGK